MQALAPSQDVGSASPAPFRVLLVDDDANDRDLISALIRNLCHEVVETNSYESALEALRAESFDVAIVDYLLGARNGIEMILEAQEAGSDTPAILLTGIGDPALDRRALAHGALDFLLKNELTPAGLDRSIRYAVEHGRSMRAIQDAEELYKSTFEALSTMVCVIGEDGLIIAVNRAWRVRADEHGVVLSAVGTGQNYLDVVDRAAATGDASALEIARGIRRIISGECELFRTEYCCRTPLRCLWFYLRVTPFRRRGKLHAVIAHEDITERHEAEEAARRSRNGLSRAQALAKIGSWYHLVAHDEFEWSPQLLRIVGANASSMERSVRWIVPFLHPGDASRVEQDMQRAMHERRPVSLTHRIVRYDGSMRFVEQRIEFLTDSHGNLEEVTGTLQDVTALRRAEVAAANSERRFRALIEHSANAKALLNPRGEIVFAAPTALELLGLGEAAVLGRIAADFLHATQVREVSKAFRRLLRQPGATIQIEHQLRNADGSWRLCESVLTNLIHEPAVEAVVWNARDITERVSAQRALRRSQARYRWLSESGLVGVFEGELGGGLHYANPAFLHMLGYTDHDLHARNLTWESAGLGEFASGDGETARSLRAHGPIAPTHRELTRKDGTRLPVLAGCALLESGSDRVIGLVVDVTENMRIRRELQRTEQRYLTLFTNANDFVFTVGTDGTLTSFNDAGRRITGYTAEEAIGRRIDDLLRVDDGTLMDVLESCLQKSGEYRAQECTVFGAGGRSIVLEISAQPLLEAGERTGWQAIARDITERRSLERQLHQSQKMEAIGRLAGGIAHDFNNILTVVLGHSATLAASISESDPIHPQLTAINEAGMRAAGLTRQLLAFSRRNTLHTSPVDLNQVITRMQHMLRRVIGEQYELSCLLRSDATIVKADTSQLEQILVNLVVNARDAMPEGGCIHIVTSVVGIDEDLAGHLQADRPGDYVVMSVADSGIGMNEETRQRIFEPFFTTKEVGKGTGLGLSTVYGIVHQLGGGISVESLPGQGSTFSIFLPQSAESPSDKPQREPRIGIRPGTRLLLVEDEEAVWRFLVTHLTAAGFEVTQASNGIAALEEMERMAQPPDLVLSDVVMPGMKGPELIRRVRERWPGLRCVLMSGYAETLGDESALTDVPLVSKPFSPSELLHTLAKTLRGGGKGTQEVRRILLVDDDAALRTLLRIWLESASYEVLEAEDGSQAMKVMQTTPADLVLTDLVMPVQEGLETIPMLRRQFPGTPVIAMSGAFHGEMLRVAERLGAVAVLPKPLSEELLLRTIQTCPPQAPNSSP